MAYTIFYLLQMPGVLYAVLAKVSLSYPPLKGRLPMYYSPVRDCCPKTAVSLACIRHAASVHPEPGSNSPFDFSSDVSLTSFFLFEIDVFLG